MPERTSIAATSTRVLVALTMMTALLTAVTPASEAGAGVPGNLRVVSQTSWVESGGTFQIDLDVEGPAGGSVELTVHPKVDSRSEFESSIADGPRDLPLLVVSSELDGQSQVSFSVPLTVEPEPGSLTLDEAGVYPVEVSLLDIDGTRIARLTTHIVLVPDTLAGQEPLTVALAVPLRTDVALQPNGVVSVTPADQGSIDSLTSALRAVPDVPATLSLSPETVSSLDAARRNALRDALNGRLLLPRPFVDLDVTAWLDAGLDSEYLNALAAGLTTTIDLLSTEPATNIWLAGSTLTPNSLATLGGLGYEKIVFEEDELEALDASAFPLTLTQQFLVEDANGQRYPAAAIDEELRSRFAIGADPTLAAHQILAEMSVLFFDQPGRQRGVIAAPPDDWSADAGLLRIVLDGLNGNPILTPVTMDTWFDTVGSAFEGGQNADLGFTLDREIESTPAFDLSAFSRRYSTTAADLFSFSRLVGPDDGALAAMNDLLLIAGTTGLSATESDQYLRAITAEVNESTAAIRLVDPPRRITFAAREGAVPVVIENAIGRDVSLLVSMSSEKLEFPDGDSVIVDIPPGVHEISLDVSARTSGDSVLDLTLSSPDRGLTLDSTRVTIRSTALSGLGLIIAGIALLFLLVWWIRTRRSRRLNRRLIVSNDDAAGNVPTPQTV
jgi:hypothetical protein